jgi:lipopolysaccharide biosynthesis glycosyltransferase
LNITFDKKWYEIDFKYNSFFLTERNDTKDYRIIHYTGSSKPWHYRNKHPYKNLYWKYLKMTPFYPFFPEDLYVKNIIKNYFITPVKNIIRSSVPGQVKKFIKKRVL